MVYYVYERKPYTIEVKETDTFDYMYWNLKMITFISDLDHTLIYSKRNINIDKNYAT